MIFDKDHWGTYVADKFTNCIVNDLNDPLSSAQKQTLQHSYTFTVIKFGALNGYDVVCYPGYQNIAKDSICACPFTISEIAREVCRRDNRKEKDVMRKELYHIGEKLAQTMDTLKSGIFK